MQVPFFLFSKERFVSWEGLKVKLSEHRCAISFVECVYDLPVYH